tara:strand:+ start:150 stop:389 length:240 start_codon:yes stop_codon:yes gene_type:complete
MSDKDFSSERPGSEPVAGIEHEYKRSVHTYLRCEKHNRFLIVDLSRPVELLCLWCEAERLDDYVDAYIEDKRIAKEGGD